MTDLLAPVQNHPYVGGNAPGAIQVDASGLQNLVKNNFLAALAPTVTDDSSQGFQVGSTWWTTAGEYFFLDDASVGAADWTQVNAPGGAGAVSSVFTRTGAVVAAASDYAASLIDNDSTVAGAFVDDALDNVLPLVGGTLTGDLVVDANLGINTGVAPVSEAVEIKAGNLFFSDISGAASQSIFFDDDGTKKEFVKFSANSGIPVRMLQDCSWGNLKLIDGMTSIKNLGGDIRMRTTASGRLRTGTSGGTSWGIVDGATLNDFISFEQGGVIVKMSNLPTSDPVNAGQLWNDTGTMKISTG